SQFQRTKKLLEFTLDIRLLASLSGAWKMNFTIVLIMPLADFTTLKGANSNPISFGKKCC
ncbi:MAG: hypothetical protein RQ760_17730, partial [Sedimentisphaerales bacterium]|nr:hypothetical protein [Sedimentisphaerales bacterium]